MRPFDPYQLLEYFEQKSRSCSADDKDKYTNLINHIKKTQEDELNSMQNHEKRIKRQKNEMDTINFYRNRVTQSYRRTLKKAK